MPHRNLLGSFTDVEYENLRFLLRTLLSGGGPPAFDDPGFRYLRNIRTFGIGNFQPLDAGNPSRHRFRNPPKSGVIILLDKAIVSVTVAGRCVLSTIGAGKGDSATDDLPNVNTSTGAVLDSRLDDGTAWAKQGKLAGIMSRTNADPAEPPKRVTVWTHHLVINTPVGAIGGPTGLPYVVLGENTGIDIATTYNNVELAVTFSGYEIPRDLVLQRGREIQ